MGVKRIREDSIKELKKRKTVKELTEENERLRHEVVVLNDDLAATQEALVEVYEMIIGGDNNG